MGRTGIRQYSEINGTTKRKRFRSTVIEKYYSHVNTFSSGWCLHHRDFEGSFIFACVQKQCLWLPSDYVDVVGCSGVLVPASYERLTSVC